MFIGLMRIFFFFFFLKTQQVNPSAFLSYTSFLANLVAGELPGVKGVVYYARQGHGKQC